MKFDSAAESWFPKHLNRQEPDIFKVETHDLPWNQMVKPRKKIGSLWLLNQVWGYYPTDIVDAIGFLSQGMQLKLKQETLLQQSNNCPTAKSSLKVRSEQRHLFHISSDSLAWKSIYLSSFRYLLWRGGQFREREEGKHCIGWQRSYDCCCHFVSFYISCGAQRLQIQPALVYCLSPFQIDTFLNACMTILLVDITTKTSFNEF